MQQEPEKLRKRLEAGESEAIRDKIAGGEAAHDNTVGERVEEFTVDPAIEAILVAEERVDEFSVDPSIEAIQSRETNRQRS